MQFWKRIRSIPGAIETLTREEQEKLAKALWYEIHGMTFDGCTTGNLKAIIVKAQRVLDLLDAP